jgi:hypothetical protein
MRKSLNEGNLTLRLLTWDHGKSTLNEGKLKVKGIKGGIHCIWFLGKNAFQHTDLSFGIGTTMNAVVTTPMKHHMQWPTHVALHFVNTWHSNYLTYPHTCFWQRKKDNI